MFLNSGAFRKYCTCCFKTLEAGHPNCTRMVTEWVECCKLLGSGVWNYQISETHFLVGGGGWIENLSINGELLTMSRLGWKVKWELMSGFGAKCAFFQLQLVACGCRRLYWKNLDCNWISSLHLWHLFWDLCECHWSYFSHNVTEIEEAIPLL